MSLQAISWSFVKDQALKHKRSLIIANITAIFAVIISAPIPLLMPLMVDEVLLNKPGRIVNSINAFIPAHWHGPALYIFSVLLFTFLLRLIFLALNTLHERVFTHVAKHIIYKVRLKLINRLSSISMSEYETLGSATVASHLVTDVETLDAFLSFSISRFIISVLSMLAVAIVLLLIHWPLALFILLLNPAIILFSRRISQRIKHWKKAQNSAFELFQQSVSDTLDAIHQLRAANRERHYLNDVAHHASRVKETSADFSWKSGFINRLSFTIFLFGFDTFRAISMVIVVFSDLSVGQMLAIFGYLWFMMSPIQELINIQQGFYGAQSALKRINTLLDLKEDPHHANESNPFTAQAASFELKQLSFDYPSNQTPVLNNISLKAHSGQTIAIVGSSGSGKSTLVQLLLGLYTPKSGQILFNDVPIESIGWDTVRDHVSSVLQSPALFNDTVRNNLTLGQNFSDEVLWDALATAQIKDTIDQLEQKLDTIVGRNGVRLSGGQRQRLAIARMLLTQPKLVILDEATSALDTETEANVHSALKQALQNTTMVIIAHRLSTVRDADCIYVMENGEICASGTHSQLIEQKGLYSQLYNRH